MARKRKHIIPIRLIELETDNYHILIETTFANNTKGIWAIDTGASKTVFDINLKDHYQLLENALEDVQSAGIGETQIETQSGTLPSVTINELTIREWPVALIDLQHINTLYKQFTKESLVGLIGSDFLVKHQAIIDFKKLSLTIYQ